MKSANGGDTNNPIKHHIKGSRFNLLDNIHSTKNKNITETVMII